MIYKITFLSEEADKFKRVFEAAPEATFQELSDALLKSVGYPDDQMTSFFTCNDRWERQQEVTRVETESSFEYDNMVMDQTRLEELLQDKHQKLIYIFDPMFERSFFGELSDIQAGKSMTGVKLIEETGKAPKQLETEDNFNLKENALTDIDDDFYGDSEYDEDELDAEGFGDMNFDDSSLF